MSKREKPVLKEVKLGTKQANSFAIRYGVSVLIVAVIGFAIMGLTAPVSDGGGVVKNSWYIVIAGILLIAVFVAIAFSVSLSTGLDKLSAQSIEELEALANTDDEVKGYLQSSTL